MFEERLFEVCVRFALSWWRHVTVCSFLLTCSTRGACTALCRLLDGCAGRLCAAAAGKLRSV